MTTFLLTSRTNKNIDLFRKIGKYVDNFIIYEKNPNYEELFMDDFQFILGDYEDIPKNIFHMDRTFYFLYNIPDDEILPHDRFISMKFFDYETSKSYKKIKRGVYEKNNNLMILWGSSFTSKLFTNENNIDKKVYMNQVKDIFIRRQIKNNIKGIKIINKESIHKLNNTNIIYFKEEGEEDKIIEILSYNNNIITNSNLGNLIFSSNLHYFEDLTTLKEIPPYDSTKKENINKNIKDNYLIINKIIFIKKYFESLVDKKYKKIYELTI